MAVIPSYNAGSVAADRSFGRGAQAEPARMTACRLRAATEFETGWSIATAALLFLAAGAAHGAGISGRGTSKMYEADSLLVL